MEIKYERADGNANGGRFAFTSEEGWRLHGMWSPAQEGEQPAPALVVLRSPHDVRRESYALQRDRRLDRRWRGSAWSRAVPATRAGSPSLDWHLRRAAMLTGRTIASLQVYDALRALQAVAELPGIDGRRLASAGRGGMAAVALYAGVLHGGLEAVCLDGPPATQDGPSNPDGTGEAIEMLFALRVTDLPPGGRVAVAGRVGLHRPTPDHLPMGRGPVRAARCAGGGAAHHGVVAVAA